MRAAGIAARSLRTWTDPALDPKSARVARSPGCACKEREGGLQVGLVAVGLGRDGPRAGERARRKRNRGLEWRLRAEEGERTDVRAPSSRERRRGAGERALLGCDAEAGPNGGEGWASAGAGASWAGAARAREGKRKVGRQRLGVLG